MAKRKAHGTLNQWLSANTDCKERRFLQVGNSLLLSKTFQELSSSAKNLYLCIAMDAAKEKEFEFPLVAATKYGIAASTFRRALKELMEKGFIRLKSSGRISRENNKYEFSLDWKTGKR